MMQVFKTDASRFKEVKRLLLLQITFLLVIIIPFIITIANITNTKSIHARIQSVIVVIGLIAFAIAIYKLIGRQKDFFNSYSITITNTVISREQYNLPIMSISLDDISEIEQHQNGYIIVKGTDIGEIIGIPAQMENQSQLQSTLESIIPITTISTRFVPYYKNIAVGLAASLFMFCVYALNNKLIITAAGCMLIILLLWSYIKIRNNKNFDQNTRKVSRWLAVVLASVILVMVLKLTGFAHAD